METLQKIGNVYVKASNLKVLKTCIEINEPVLLQGQTGTGKTLLVSNLASNQPTHTKLIRVSLNGNTSTEEIIGRWLVENGTTVWQDGVLITAMKLGYWIVFDEINSALPEILFTLHSLLDDERAVRLAEKDNEYVKAHKNFRFFATMNPPDEYAGTKEMNKALLSRFNTVINIDIPDEGTESTLIQEQTEITPSQATKLVMMATQLREAKKKEDIFYYCSTRDLVHAGKLLRKKIPIKHAVLFAILNKMGEQEQTVVKTLIEKTLTLPDDEIRSYSELKEQYDKLTSETAQRETEIKMLKQKLANISEDVIEQMRGVLLSRSEKGL